MKKNSVCVALVLCSTVVVASDTGDRRKRKTSEYTSAQFDYTASKTSNKISNTVTASLEYRVSFEKKVICARRVIERMAGAPLSTSYEGTKSIITSGKSLRVKHPQKIFEQLHEEYAQHFGRESYAYLDSLNPSVQVCEGLVPKGDQHYYAGSSLINLKTCSISLLS